MPDANELRILEDKLLRVDLPQYIGVREILSLNDIYKRRLEKIRRERINLEKMTLEVEKRIGVLKAKVVVLE